MRKWKVASWLFLAAVAMLVSRDLPADGGSNPIPYIQGVSPVSIAPGSAQFTLTVTGSNFDFTSVVQWNGSSLVTTLTSGKLSATVPASDLVTSTTANITVMNPGPPSTVSNAIYFTVTNPSASVNFSSFQHPSTGQGPFQPAIADFNGDGKLDLAVSNQGDSPGTVFFFAGNGDGTFQSPTSTNVGSSPAGVAAGDFNNDGIQDLVVVNSGSATVTILAGNLSTPLQSAVTTSLPSQDLSPFQVAAADFNGDGDLDLAVTCQSGGEVVILLGNGDGTFAPNPMSFGAMVQPQGVAIADFDGDGKLDLAVSDSASNAVWILNGNGDGTFSTGTPYATATSPVGVAVGDFNADGAADLAVADLTAHEVSILLNSGTGTFPTHTEYATPPGAYFLVVADLNGDGLLDLAVTSNFANAFNVLLGAGGGGFASALNFTAGPNTIGIASADFTGNGQLDLAVTDNVNNTISLQKQSAKLTFIPTSLTFPSELVGTRSSPMTLTMTNSGTVTVTFFSILGNDPTHFLQTNTCGGTLTPGASCTFSVTFSPTSTGPVSSSITLRDNAPGNPQSIGLSGTGAAPIAGLSPSSLSFASTVVGSKSSPQTVTLSNTGTWPLTIGTIAVTGDYTETTTCPLSPSTLAANSSCTISVTFQPTATGVRTGSLTVTDNSNAIGSSTQTTSLTGTATASVATLAPTTLTFGSQAVGTTSPGQTATLTNAGSSALTISSITTSGDFGESTACGSSLAAGQSCSITVTFTPTASGTRTGVLTVTDHSSGGTGVSQTVSLTGTAIAPVASLSPASLTYSSQAVGSTSPAQTVTLSNTGSASLIVTAITGNSEFVPSQNCVGTVNAGATCAITVTFSPSTNGARNGTLTVTDNSTGGTQAAALSGTGSAPEVSYAPSSITFASQGVGTASAAQTVTVTNSGAQALTISSIAASGDFTETTTCGSSLAANGATCTVSVSFKPTASGTRSGSLSVTDNSNNVSGATQTLALTGTGTVATASLSPSTLTFASQEVGTTSASQTATLTNTGAAALSITSIANGGANAGDFTTSNTCNGSVAAGASCAITVTFKPAAAGTRTATVTVTDNHNGVSGSSQTVSLTGTGTAPAVQLSASTVAFDNQNVGTSSSVQVITITNTGTASLTLSSVTASGDFSATNACGTSLGPGANCTVTVTFKPTAPGSRTGTLSVTDNASPGSQTVSLTGTGVGAQASISPLGLTFAGELTGVSSSAQTVKVTNTGNAALGLTGISASGDFSETNNCGASLAAGASCTVTVTFKPGTSGSRSGSLTISNSAGSPQVVSLAGTGQDFSLTAESTSASISAGQTVTYTLTLNPAGGLHQLVSLSCAGAPSASTCAVSPDSVSPSGATTLKATVTTRASSTVIPQSTPPVGPRNGEWLFVALLATVGIGTLGGARLRTNRSPRLVGIAVLSFVGVLVLGIAACGGGGSSPVTSNSGTPPGTYNLTVTGSTTSGSVTVTHNLGLTLQVH